MWHHPGGSALVLIVASLSIIKLSGPSLAQEVNEPELDDEVAEAFLHGSSSPMSSEDGEIKLNWAYHNNDHSRYWHRSLMSAANVKQLETSDDPSSQLDSRELDLDEDDVVALNSKDYVEREWQLMFRALDSNPEANSMSVVYQIGKYTSVFEDILAELEPQCRRDIMHMRNSVKKHRMWALRMVDSNGKIPSGVTYGRFSSPGDYEECMDVNLDEHVMRQVLPSDDPKTTRIDQESGLAVEHYKFHGKYCLLDFRLPLPARPRDKILSIHEPVLNLTNTEIERQFPMMKNYSSFASVFYEIGYLHAFCLPSSCDIQDVRQAVGKSLEGLFISVNSTVDCQEKHGPPVPLRTSQIISATILALVFANAVLASFMHRSRELKLESKENDRHAGGGTSKQHEAAREFIDAEKLARTGGHAPPSRLSLRSIFHGEFYTNCFSIQTNFARLCKPDPRGLTFVHYTRLVAMALTVITHTAGMGTLQAITKPADATNSDSMFRDFLPQMLANAFSSIQIFFFMAGFMLVVSTYPSIKRHRGQLSLPEYALKRAVRLMPGLAATICINFLWPLFVDGPMLNYFIRMIVITCESNWWRTLLFMSNFDHVEKMCLRHSYFSASDYQLHMMAFPLLILLYKQPVVALYIAGMLTVAGFVAQVIIVLTKQVLPFIMVDYLDKEAFFNVVHYVHHPVWNHMSAFFYGFIIGYLVVKQIRINLRPQTVARLWYLVTPVAVVSIFAPYYWNHYKRQIHRWQIVLYVLFDRFALLTVCAWISYASMVLSRPPRKSNNKPDKQQNLPDIVAHDYDAMIKQQQKLTGALSSVSLVGINQDGKDKASTCVDTRNLLNTGAQRDGSSPSSMRRERSTPSFLTLQAHEEEQSVDSNAEPEQDNASCHHREMLVGSPIIGIGHDHGQQLGVAGSSSPPPMATLGGGLRPVASSMNVSLCASTDGSALRRPESSATIARHFEQGGAPTVGTKTPVHVSNVNTLCLILSRLTFQLYLFNMVVLWIDVNHSKYNWYFSYYFTIVKAFAVYICSSLMAMVFFVTMESPCLTIYIAWVKSRAQRRDGRHKLFEQQQHYHEHQHHYNQHRDDRNQQQETAQQQRGEMFAKQPDNCAVTAKKSAADSINALTGVMLFKQRHRLGAAHGTQQQQQQQQQAKQ